MNDVWLPADCNERSSQHEFRRLYLIPPMRMEGQRQKSSMLIDLRCRMVFQSLCGLGRDYRDRLSIYIRERGYYSSKSWPRRKILREANQGKLWDVWNRNCPGNPLWYKGYDLAVIRAERISINWKFTGPVRLQKAMEVEELAKSNRETEILVQAMATRKFLHGMVLFCTKALVGRWSPCRKIKRDGRI